MDSVIRGLIVYFFLLVVFRASGKRTLAQMTSFDLVLLLIISETIQQAMVDDDHSMTNSFLLILTLAGASVVLAWVREKWRPVEQWLDDVPLIVMENGKLHRDRMFKTRVDEHDIMMAARLSHGLERLDQIKYAIVENDGDISIIPREGKQGESAARIPRL